MSRRARGSSPQRVVSCRRVMGRVWVSIPAHTPPHGCVEELESSPPCHGGDRGFKSRHGRKPAGPGWLGGQQCAVVVCVQCDCIPPKRSCSSVGERRAYNADVGGSTPSGTTTAVLSRWWAQRPVKPFLRTCRFNSGHRDQIPRLARRVHRSCDTCCTHTGTRRTADQ